MRKKDLIHNPKNLRPHVVLLGAGASRAAFPAREASGKRLPLMNDFVETLELTTLLNNANIDTRKNFESIYPQIKDKTLQDTIEKQINKYFSTMALPTIATDYDRLLLSLREKDAVFTFNWDPFLFEAWLRNCRIAKLPEIFFLHGNVRIGSCICHQKWGRKWDTCPTCNKKYDDVPLLYPIENKNYSENEYIKEAWKNAKYFFANAFTITIFGYGAPNSDADAVELLRSAWFEKNTRNIAHIEIIDTEKEDVLASRWSTFTPTHHYSLTSHFNNSRISRWPRRTCEALFYPMTQGEACEDFPLPSTHNLPELHQYIAQIAKHEKN